MEIQPTQVIVERDGAKEEIPADAVFLLTGYHPDCDLYRRAGIRLHRETMSPEFNPDTFETNVPGVFLAGGAICGRDTSNIFIENGRFHGETIIKVHRRAAWEARRRRSLTRADGRGQRAYGTEIRPPSVRAETLNVLKAAAAIVVIVAAYIFRPSFGAPDIARANRGGTAAVSETHS